MTRKILTLQEVSEMTLIPLNTLLYYRYNGGNGPRTWKLGRRIVAYESDVLAWMEKQYESTSSTKAG